MIDFAERYRGCIAGLIINKGGFITNGNCKSFEDYKARTAELSGLQRAVEEFDDLLSSYMTEDEGDNAL